MKVERIEPNTPVVRIELTRTEAENLFFLVGEGLTFHVSNTLVPGLYDSLHELLGVNACSCRNGREFETIASLKR